ncbi:hypothetical protein [Haloplanus natans]|uniref:hypothetical protein n=1 Tax=Haloplanus natans TaxID=376171 RepID=UPI0006782837|nr:hypothetical protein [Haloplanus natans]
MSQTDQPNTEQRFLSKVWRKTADVVEETEDDIEQRATGEQELLADICRRTGDVLEQRLDTRGAAEEIADQFGIPADEVEAILESHTTDEDAADGENAPEELAGDENRDKVDSVRDVEQRAKDADEVLALTGTARQRKHKREAKERAGDGYVSRARLRRIRERMRRQDDEDDPEFEPDWFDEEADVERRAVGETSADAIRIGDDSDMMDDVEQRADDDEQTFADAIRLED